MPLWYLEHFSLPTVEQVALSQLHASMRPRPASHSCGAVAAMGLEPGPVPQDGARSGEQPGQQPGGWYPPAARFRVRASERSLRVRTSLEK